MVYVSNFVDTDFLKHSLIILERLRSFGACRGYNFNDRFAFMRGIFESLKDFQLYKVSRLLLVLGSIFAFVFFTAYHNQRSLRNWAMVFMFVFRKCKCLPATL